jgi:hypothetical protein
VGAFLGATLLQPAQAAGSGPAGNAAPFTAQFFAAGTPAAGAQGPHGQGACDTLTVSSVNGNTITAKAGDGSTVTIHTAASTTYTKAGKAATASAVTAGSRIHVRGTHNSDGSVTATAIDVE